MNFKRILGLIIIGITILLMTSSCELIPTEVSMEEVVNDIVAENNLEQEDSAAVFYLGDLNEGDVVTEENVEKGVSKDSTSIKVSEPSYLMMIDYAPMSRFSHEVKYVVVSKRTGEVLGGMNARWLPTVNGEILKSAKQLYENPEMAEWYKPSWIFNASGTPINWEDFIPPIWVTPEIEGAIVVNGNDDKHPDVGISTDANNMYEFYKRFLGSDKTKKLEYPDNTENDLEDAIRDLVNNQHVNDMTIYIVTHGGRDVLVMGDTRMTSTEFKNILQKFPDVTFKIIIDACHSGSFVDDLEDLDNVAIVLTATDADHSSYGDLDGEGDPNPEDEGGEWTSGFLEDLYEYTMNQADWDYIVWIADVKGVSEKVALYWYAWESAWDKDYARMQGLTEPQRSSKVSFPPFGSYGLTVSEAIAEIVEHLNLDKVWSIVFYLGEVGPNDNVEAEDTEIPISTLSYLFLVDYVPGARFPHKTGYVTVSRFGGEVHQIPGEWIPIVNGESILSGKEIYAEDTLWKWSNLPEWWELPHGFVDWEALNPGPLPSYEKECAIVVNGNNPKLPDVDISKDADNMAKFFKRFLNPDSVKELFYDNNGKDNLEDAISELVEKGCDDVTVYIVSHGGTDVLIMGDDEMSSEDFVEIIESFPEVDFKVIIDACYSGSFIDDLKEVKNVVIVLTSTDENKPAYGDIDDHDVNGDQDEGGEWSSGFLEDLIEYTSNDATWDYILKVAEDLEISEKVVLYWYAWESAVEKDYAKKLGWSEPMRWSPYGEEIPELGEGMTYEDALESLIQFYKLDEVKNIVFYLGELGPGDEVQDDSTTIAVSSPIHIFLIDLEPGARFSHRLIFSFIDKKTGEIIGHDASWIPLINGESPLAGEDIYSNSDLWAWFYGWEPPSGSLDWTGFEPVGPPEWEVEGAVVVNGNNPNVYPDCGISTDASNMKKFYEDFLGEEWVKGLEYPDNTKEDLKDSIYELIEKGAKDISIYIVTHGSPDLLIMGSGVMSAIELRDMLSEFSSEFKDVKFKIIIDACYSGSFVDDLSDLPNVAIILTATNESRPSYGDIDGDGDPNPGDEGGEWTSGLLHDLMKYTSNKDIWNWILSVAEEYGLSDKVVLYWYAWESAWELDYARILGFSVPKRSPFYELPQFPFDDN